MAGPNYTTYIHIFARVYVCVCVCTREHDSALRSFRWFVFLSENGRILIWITLFSTGWHDERSIRKTSAQSSRDERWKRNLRWWRCLIHRYPSPYFLLSKTISDTWLVFTCLTIGFLNYQSKNAKCREAGKYRKAQKRKKNKNDLSSNIWVYVLLGPLYACSICLFFTKMLSGCTYHFIGCIYYILQGALFCIVI